MWTGISAGDDYRIHGAFGDAKPEGVACGMSGCRVRCDGSAAASLRKPLNVVVTALLTNRQLDTNSWLEGFPSGRAKDGVMRRGRNVVAAAEKSQGHASAFRRYIAFQGMFGRTGDEALRLVEGARSVKENCSVCIVYSNTTVFHAWVMKYVYFDPGTSRVSWNFLARCAQSFCI